MPINRTIKYCHERYSLKNGQCKECPNMEIDLCHSKNCGNCFTQIFFQGNRTYNCICSTYSYVCRYMLQYSSEILYALEKFKELFTSENGIKHINAMSIGCGPCSELFAIEQFIKTIEYNLDVVFNGFDKNNIWSDVQQKVIEVIPFRVNICFENCFDFINSNNSFSFPNMLILNYVLSDIVKSNGDIDNFIESIVTEIIDKMPNKSIIIINDINHNTQARDYYKIILDKIEVKNIISQKSCSFQGYKYGAVYKKNNIFDVVHPKNLRHLTYAYNTKTFCSSAQLLIFKKSNKL